MVPQGNARRCAAGQTDTCSAEAWGPPRLVSMSRRTLHEAECTRDAAAQRAVRHCSSRSAVGPGSANAPAVGGRASQILRWGRCTRPHAVREEGTMSASQHRRQLKLEAHAHRMRSASSEPERVLWQALRAGQLGVRFGGSALNVRGRAR